MTFPDPASQSAALYARAKTVLPDGGSRSTIKLDPYMLYVAEASGAEIVDVDGNRLLDFNNNYTSLIHGHSYPPVIEAVTRQIGRGTAYSFGSETEIALAELLCERAPSFERIRFMNSGSEAVMNAIKAARAYTGRPRIAKCEGFYHGSYDYAEVSLASGPGDWTESDPPALAYCAGTPRSLLDEVVVIPFNDREASERIIEANADALACILIDTQPLRAGLIPIRRDYLEMLERVAARHGILLVFDEVVSFRAGPSGSQGVLGTRPDLTALGKIIGGGFPVGAVAGREDVMAVFEADPEHGTRLHHGGTFNANPVTMAAGQAAMADMTDQAFARLNAMGEKVRHTLRQALQLAGEPGQVTGENSLFKVYLNERPMNGYRDSVVSREETTRLAAIRERLIDRGIFVSGGLIGCVSTATTESHIDRLAEELLAAMRATQT